MRYKVVLHQDSDGVAASVPGLPGCWSQGADEHEALANIRDAIEDYLAAQEELVRGSRP
jgi:predicted RNase H-like HicB family nuclease